MNILRYLYEVDNAVREIEHRGVYVDVGFCRDNVLLAQAEEQRLLDKINHPEALGGPTNDVLERRGQSHKKMQEWLHGDLKLPHAKFWKKGPVKRGEVKLDGTALEWLAGAVPKHRELLNDIISLRRERSCIKYLLKLPKFVSAKTGRIHCSFSAASESDDTFGAVTGRFTCKLPELHQIPRDKRKDKYRIRKAFRAQKDGHVIIALDYKALEVVMLGHYGVDLFGNDEIARLVVPGSPDLHSLNAVGTYRALGFTDRLQGIEGFLADERNLADGLKGHSDPWMRQIRDDIKTVWYAISYGKEAYGLGNTLKDAQGNLIGERAAQRLLDALFQARPLLKQYQEFIWRFVQANAGIGSWLGRWRDLSFWIPGQDWQVRSAYRKALNHPMQAGGAEVVGLAMGALARDSRLRRLGFAMILQVHDEILLEGPEENAAEAMEIAKEIMIAINGLKGKLTVSGSYGPTWEDAK